MKTKTQLKIYPETHPYVAVVDGIPYHLNQKQFDAIIKDMEAGRGTITITYHDPVRGEGRPIPLNLYKISDMDLAEVVRENNWKKQGGYVCGDGRLVDVPADCEPKDAYKIYEENNRKFSGVKKVQQSDSFRKAYEQGKEDGRKNYMQVISNLVERHGEEVFQSGKSQYDVVGYNAWKNQSL